MCRCPEATKKVVHGEATHPTVSTESVLIMATIDAHEGRDVGIFDITGDFLGANIIWDIRMALCERLVELVVKIAPQIYCQHVIYEKGMLVFYVTFKK